MKNSLNLSIAKPCSENWSNFTTTHDGAFCGTCQKVVVDFTRMQDADIVNFFANGTRTCGRFRAEQLTAYQTLAAPRINIGAWLLKAGCLSLFLILAGKTSIAQVRTEPQPTHQQATVQKISEGSPQVVKGVVRSNDDQSPMAGVNIYLKNSTVGTISDDKGAFTFPKKLNAGDTIVFSFIGYKTTDYVIQKNQSDLDMSIDIGLVFDEVVIMGDVTNDKIYEEKSSAWRRLVTGIKSIF